MRDQSQEGAFLAISTGMLLWQVVTYCAQITHTGSKLPRLRSGFRQPAQTPAKRLNFDCVRLRLTSLRMTDRRK